MSQNQLIEQRVKSQLHRRESSICRICAKRMNCADDPCFHCCECSNLWNETWGFLFVWATLYIWPFVDSIIVADTYILVSCLVGWCITGIAFSALRCISFNLLLTCAILICLNWMHWVQSLMNI